MDSNRQALLGGIKGFEKSRLKHTVTKVKQFKPTAQGSRGTAWQCSLRCSCCPLDPTLAQQQLPQAFQWCLAATACMVALGRSFCPMASQRVKQKQWPSAKILPLPGIAHFPKYASSGYPHSLKSIICCIPFCQQTSNKVPFTEHHNFSPELCCSC